MAKRKTAKGRGRPKGAKTIEPVKMELPQCIKCKGKETVKLPNTSRKFPHRPAKIGDKLYRGFCLTRWKCSKCGQLFPVKTPLV